MTSFLSEIFDAEIERAEMQECRSCVRILARLAGIVREYEAKRLTPEQWRQVAEDLPTGPSRRRGASEGSKENPDV